MFEVVLNTLYEHMCFYLITDRRYNPCRYIMAQNLIEIRNMNLPSHKGAHVSLNSDPSFDHKGTKCS